MKILILMVRSLTFVAALSLSNSLAAESLANSTGPAELPPVGFTDAQYVDSKGCVYIRAGQGGTVQWIPRVNRLRQVICGFAPSFKSAVSQKAQVNPLSIQTPVENWQPEVDNVAAAPEAMETTIVTVRGTIGPTEVPDGYRSAWEDDRLNIYSGLQTAEGLRDADQRWSQDVPSQIINQNEKAKPHAQHGQLVYPFTDIEQQKMFLEAQGDYVLEPKDDGTIRLVPRNAAVSDGRGGQTALQHTEGGNLLVQVATFGVGSNAAKTKARLVALGLPVQVRRITRADKTYHVVLTGPFEDPRKVKLALAAVRKAGFGDTFMARR